MNMTTEQARRLYRKAYEAMAKDLCCSSWDWHTLAVVSPSWYRTLRTVSEWLNDAETAF